MPHSAPLLLGQEHVISACSSVNEPTELQGAESRQQWEKPLFAHFLHRQHWEGSGLLLFQNYMLSLCKHRRSRKDSEEEFEQLSFPVIFKAVASP